MANLAPLEVVLTLNGEQFSGQLAAAKAQTEEFSKTVSSSSSNVSSQLSKVGTALNDVGGKIAAVGLAGVSGFGGIAAAATYFGSQFESATQKVAGNTNMSSADLAKMREAIINIGDATGTSFSSLENAFIHATSLGFSMADSINIVSWAAKDAANTGADVGDVTNTLAGIMHEFKIPASEAAKAMNEIQAGAASGNMKLQDFATAFGPAGAEASALKVPLDQTIAAFSALTENGVNAAEAGTQVKEMLLQISAPGTQATTALSALSKVSGIDLVSDFSSSGLQAKGLTGVLSDLAKATKGNIPEMMQYLTGVTLTKKETDLLQRASNGQLSALKELTPNIRGLFGLYQLTNNAANDYSSTLGKIDKAASQNNVQKNFIKTLQDLTTQVNQARNMLEGLAYDIYTALKPDLESFMKSALSFLKVIDEWVQHNKPLTASLIENGLKISLILLAVGKFIKLGSGIIKLYQDWQAISKILTETQILQKTAQLAMNGAMLIWQGILKAATALQWLFNIAMDANPIGLVIIGITALIVIGALLITHWKQVTAAAQDVWQKTTLFFGAMFAFIKQHWEIIPQIMLGPLGIVVGLISSHFDEIRNIIGGVLGGAWSWGSDMVQNFINGINGKIGQLRGTVASIANTIKSYLHFSKPDTGPLAEADKWMPDMVDLLANGVRMNLPKLQMAINGALAGTGANSTAYSYQQINNVNMNSGNGNSWQQRQDMSRTLQQLSYQSQFM